MSSYAYRNDWRRRNKDRVRAYHRKSRTGWTEEQYAAAFLEQDGACYVCRIPSVACRNGLVADHCHRTNTPRRLLCDPCNTAIGLLRDSPELLRQAASYLEKFAK